MSAHRQLGWAFACVVVAALLMPLTDLLDRYLPRWLALVSTMLSLAFVALVAWAAVVVNLRDGFDTLKAEAPKAAATLEAKSEVAKEFRLVERVNSLIEQFRQPSGGAAVGRAAGTAGTYFVCGILTLFFLIYGPRMLRAGFAQVRDHHRRRRVEQTVLRTLAHARGYIFAALAQAVVVSTAVGLVVWALDLPAPFILGLLAGAIGAIPTLGIVVGGLPALLLAAGLGSWRQAAVVAVVLVGLQVLEIQVVRKRVDRATVHIGPALPAIVALIGYELYGFGGAAYGAAGLVFLIAWLESIGYDDSSEPLDAGATVSDPSTAAAASRRRPRVPR